MEIKKFQVWVSHNQFSSALPEAITKKGLNFTFQMDKLTEELKNKLHGKIEVVELEEAECRQLLSAKYKIISNNCRLTVFN